MKQQRHLFPISFMARLLHVSVSRFYDWLKRGMNKRLVQRNQQTILVKIAHEETKQSYGYIRLTKHLQAQGIKISTYAVRQIKSSTSCIVSVISVSKELRRVIIIERSTQIY
jgi:hypothetical protein